MQTFKALCLKQINISKKDILKLINLCDNNYFNIDNIYNKI